MDKIYEQKTYLDSNVTNYLSEEYLHINSCGISRYTYQDKNYAIRYYRPSGRMDWHLLLVTESRMEVIVGGKSFEAEPGDVVFYAPDDPQDYTYFVSEEAPVCESFYIHFSGTAVAEVMAKSGFFSSFLLSCSGGEVKRIFTSIIAASKTGDDMTACGHLLRLLALLSPSSKQNDQAGLFRIKKAVEYLSSHFTEDIDMEFCAQKCNLSRSRFTHLFTEVMGTSPCKYQQKLRITAAQDLLENSTLSVGEIALSVGFSDPLYFSRIFKKVVGTSPIGYKKSTE